MDIRNKTVIVYGPTGPEEVLSATAFLAKYGSPVVVDPTPVGSDPIDTNPVPVENLAGSPRILVGKKDGFSVYDSAIGLLFVFNADPDRFMPVGYNFGYDLLAGLTAKPTGFSTANYGNDAPAGFVRPAGYRKRYFPSDHRLYWEKSTLPDEPEPIVETPPVTTKPDVPVVIPDKPVDNGPPVVNTNPSGPIVKKPTIDATGFYGLATWEHFMPTEWEDEIVESFASTRPSVIRVKGVNYQPNGMMQLANDPTSDEDRGNGYMMNWFFTREKLPGTYWSYPGIVELCRLFQPFGAPREWWDYNRDPAENGMHQVYRKSKKPAFLTK